MSQTSPTCRWGFISTAQIAKKNWLAIKNSGNGIVQAVASRNLSSSQDFIDECQANHPFASIPESIEGYENLINAPDIDAIYLPLPTGLRMPLVIQAAEQGKHVLCEKPCARNLGELKEMIAACQSNGVQFMDGVMFMHTQRMDKMRAVLDDGTSVGKIRRIASQFSFNGGPEFEAGNIRMNSQLEPHGALGDLGWYTIRFSLWAMNYAMPTHVTGTLIRGNRRDGSDDVVPLEISGELFFEEGVSATFYNSFVCHHQEWANISGSRGQLHLRDFVQPFHGDQLRFSVTQSVCEDSDGEFRTVENRRDYLTDETSDGRPDSQETNLFRKFGEIVLSGKLESQWPQISLQTQQVVDAVFESAIKGSGQVKLK